MAKIRKVLAYANQTFYWKEGNVYTKFGVIKAEDLEKENITEVTTSTGKKFFVFQPTIIDQLKKIKRGPQTLLLKDLATITTCSGIDNQSVVLDAGTGCGLLAIFLARIAKKVITYERNEENIAIAKKNLELLETSNVEIKNKDVYEGVDEEDLDLITLDLPEPWRVLPFAEKSLKNGRYLITYLPSITQVQTLIEQSKNFSFFHEKTLETIEREWVVEGQKVRPKNFMVGHTAFITFLKKA